MAGLTSEALFAHCKTHHSGRQYREGESPLDVSLLSPTLRPYQRDAVNWMLYRETTDKTQDVFQCEGETYSLPNGGILADEMGLGKTVEVLACILNHRYNPDASPPLEKPQVSTSTKTKIQESSLQSDPVIKEKKDNNQAKLKCLKRKAGKGNKKNETEEVPAKKRKSATYELLQAWYSIQLQEMSTVNKKTDKWSHMVGERVVKCFCDYKVLCSSLVKCPCCETWQHLDCVGVDDNYSDDYYCPKCWPKQPILNAKTTFIVSPSSIALQWKSEIAKHIKDSNFKVLIYDGVKSSGYIQPPKLIEYDVIITTYSALSKELNYAVTEESTRKLRHAKKFQTYNSPLTCIKWWRLCLDEAQMVEGHETKPAIMARELYFTNIWAVTGTPVQKSLQDLYGLIQLLHIEPYTTKAKWDLLYRDSNRMCEFFARILWRSGKKDVVHMLGIPPQTVVTHLLRFSPVEGYFYQRTHMECDFHFRQKLVRFDDLNIPLKQLDNVEVNSLMLPLLKLRQACSHPQAVRGKFLKFKHTMTMKELMVAMISKAKLDVDINLRQLISSLNGVAAIRIIECDWVEAANTYRRVLQLAQEYEKSTTVDSLQLLHTLHNLAEVIRDHRAAIPPTLRDDRLEDEANALQEAYLKKYDSKIASKREHLSKITTLLSKVSQGRTLGFTNWWERVLEWAPDPEELFRRITVHLDDFRVPGHVRLSNKLGNLPAVYREVAVWLGNADRYRQDVLNRLRVLEVKSSEELALQALSCHLKTSFKYSKKNICPICKAEIRLKILEETIFSIVKYEAPEEESEKEDEESPECSNKAVAELKKVTVLKTKSEGSWKPSQHERILQVLASYARQKVAPAKWLEEASQHLELLQLVRREFKWLRSVWSAIADQAAARDELSMAKLRLRLPTHEEEFEVRRKKRDIFVIEPTHVMDQLATLQGEVVWAESQLKKKSGILYYLKNVDDSGSVEKEPCPVCREPLTDQWSVLSCGHCFCFVCIPTLIRMGGLYNIDCPVCRVKTLKDDVSYVVSNAKKEDCQEPQIKGSFSTKVEAVVLELLKLIADEPEVKVLIFSSWDKVLEVIGEALHANDIVFHRYGAEQKYKQGVEQFKKGHASALLLPYKFGSKGLNLIEATHAFLVEPILNPAEELQAVGRIHRIGQTKPTFVHRFIVQNTLEEKMLTSLESANNTEDPFDFDKFTVAQLYDLFLLSAEKMTHIYIPT